MHQNIVNQDLQEVAGEALPWSDLSNKTVLITGVGGSLGSYIAQTLLHINDAMPEQQTKVIGVSRDRAQVESRLPDALNRADFSLVESDVTSPLSITEHVDYILHAASQASPKYYGTDPVGTLTVNTQGTYQLLEYARQNPVEAFLYFSSCEVYGQLSDANRSIAETDYGLVDPLSVRSCSAESKRMAETMCVSWRHQYGIPVKIVRPFHTYGPSMDLTGGRVYADFVTDILNNRNITLTDDGGAVRAFCYITDAVRGIFAVLLRGEPGQAYNVGNERGEASIRQLAEILAGLYPDRKLTVVRQDNARPAYLHSKVSRFVPDLTKLRALGWRAHVPLEGGFKRTIESFS